MSELERLKRRLGISTPNEQYKDRNLGTYKPYYTEDEEEEKKQQEAIKPITPQELPEYNTRRQQDELKLDFKALDAMTRDKVKDIKPRPSDNLNDRRMQSHTYRELALSNTEKEFGNKLLEDTKNSLAYYQGLGYYDQKATEAFKNAIMGQVDAYSDENVKETMMPATYKRDAMKRLDEIEKFLKSGDEKGGYKVLEGWLDMQVRDIYSKEAYKESEGLPNARKEVDKWIEDHPELGMSLGDRNIGENLIDYGARFGGSMANLMYNMYLDAATDPTTYWIALVSMAAGFILAAPTGGLSLAGATALNAGMLGGKVIGKLKYLDDAGNAIKGAKGALAVKIPRTTKWLNELSTVGAMKWGMSSSRFRSMAVREGYDQYGEMIDNGVHPDVAKALAETLGTANAIVEYAQIDSLTKVAPGIKQIAQRADDLAKKDFKSKILKAMIEQGIDYAAEDIEEVIQESNSMLIGETLSKYFAEAPNPNTWGGLQAMAKTMGTEEYRQRLADTAIQTAYGLWAWNVGMQGGGYAVNRASAKAEQSATKKKVYGYYTAEEKLTQEYYNESKEMLLGKSKLVDQLIIDAINNKSEDTMSALTVIDMTFEDMEKRPNLSNEDREKVAEARAKIKQAMGQVEYDLKVENPEIKTEPRNMQEIEQEIIEGKRAYHIDGMSEFVVEKRQEAIDKGIYDTIINGLRNGQKKSEISNAVEKLLNWKERDALAIGAYITAIETFDAEARYQYNLAALHNFQEAQQGMKKPATEKPVEPKNEADDTQVGQEAEQAATESQAPQAESQETIPQPQEPVEIVDGKFRPSDIMTMDAADILMDQKRFQFRINGTTDRLEGTNWNDDLAGVLTVWESEKKDYYVVNGHHRLRRMQELGIKDARVRVLRGMTAEQARAQGALINIAEGTADAFDVAKYMRDTKMGLEQLVALGVPPKSKIARDGAALAKLNDDLFRMATTRHIAYERAVMIGKELGEDPDGQMLFYNMIVQEEAKKGYIKDSTVQEMLSSVRSIGAAEYFQDSFLGNDLRSAVVERAELVAHVKNNLKNKKSVLKKISKTRNAMMLEQMGNVIKQEDNVKEMAAADQALYLLDKTVNFTGSKVGKMFDELAIEYVKTGDKKIFDKALKMVGDLMKSGELLKEATGKDKAMAEAIEAVAEELPGQANLLGENFAQIKKGKAANVVISTGADKGTVASLRPIVDAMRKNPLFNNVRVVFTGEDATITMTREELDNAGYFNQPEGQVTVYGYYKPVLEEAAAQRGNRDNARRRDKGDSAENQIGDNAPIYTSEYEIGINNGATPDTLLHEAIHHIQTILADADPDLYALIDRWETDVNAKAKELGIELPQGQELLANVLVISEYGYASDDPGLANLVAVDQDIIDNVAELLGKEFMALTRGDSKALNMRKITNRLQNFAMRNLQDAEGMLASKQRAIDRRLNKIKMDLRDGQTVRYFSADNTTYVIVKPKGTEYEVSFFNELGLLSTEVMGLNALSNRLQQKGIIFLKPEISRQIKHFNRDQADEIFEDDKPLSNERMAEVEKIVRLYNNARVGNFTARDYDMLAKDKMTEADRNDLLNHIFRASLQGFDKANKDVSIREYVNRFYPQHLGVPSSQNEVRLREVDGKIQVYKYDYLNYKGGADETLPTYVLQEYNTAEEAIEAYRAEDAAGLDYYRQQVFPKRFSYMPDYWDTLMEEYEDFKANYDTIRSDYNVMFDGNVKTNVSYQVKNPLINSKRIDPTKGETLKVAFKGFREGETRRISTGEQEWDSLFFIADNYNDASLYGENVEIYDVSPKARILYEGTKDFSDIAKSSIRNETMLEWASRIAIKAKEQGYDAVWFKRQGEIGTAIINREILNIPDNLKNYQLKAATDTPEFKKWFKDSKVVDENGEPLIVYHGTTHIWDVFNYSMSDIANHFGRGFYASSSYYDSQMNYLSNGGDLANRIDRLAEELMEYDDYDLIELFKEHLGTELDTADLFNFDAADFYALARSMLDGGEETVMQVYLSIQNPLRLNSKGGTMFTLEMDDDAQARLSEIEDLLEDEIDDEKIYELEQERDEIYDNAEYSSGNAQELIEAILEVSRDWNVDGDELVSYMMQRLDFYSGETAYNVIKALFSWPYEIYDYEEGVSGDRQFFQEIFREMGFDGIIYEDAKRDFFRGMNISEGTKHYIVFNPTQIKSVFNVGTFDEYNPNINYQVKSVGSAVKVDGFYSKLEQVINEQINRRYKPIDTINILKKYGVKPEELEWFEIAEFVKDKDFVTKEDLLLHMQNKRIEFTKENLGSNFINLTLPGGEKYRFNAFVYKNPNVRYMKTLHFRDLENVIGNSRYTDRVDVDGNKVLFIEELQSDWHTEGRDKGYDVEISAKNAIKLNNLQKEYDYYTKLNEPLQHEILEIRNNMNALEKLKSDMTAAFTRKKFDDPEYVRLQREYLEARNKLSMEARGELFLEDAERAELLSVTSRDGDFQRYAEEFERTRFNKNAQSNIIADLEIYREKVKELYSQMEVNNAKRLKIALEMQNIKGELEDKVPDAPLKESYIDFLFKQAIKDAVEGGYDKIAWTTGEQQADRYGLWKVLDKLEWIVNEKLYPGQGQLIGYKDGKQIIKRMMKPTELPPVIGASATKTLLAQEPWRFKSGDTEVRTLEGKGLKVGGEFHKKLYNNYIPRMVKKYVKKWGSEVDVLKISDARLENAIKAYNIDKDYRLKMLSFEENIQAFASFGSELAQLREASMTALYYTRTLYASEEDDFISEGAVMIVPTNELASTVVGLEDVIELFVWNKDGSVVDYDKYYDFIINKNSEMGTEQLSINITNEMREDVLKNGQPLFQVKGGVVATTDVSAGELKSILKLGKLPIKGAGMLADKTAINRDIILMFRPDIEDAEEADVADIQGALLPKDIDKALVQALKDNNIHFIEYYNPGRRPLKIKQLLRGAMPQVKRADITTDNFKKWFKDSHVVDYDGKPLVVYHGTKRGGFSIFDSEASHAGRQAMYFSTLNTAKSYSGSTRTIDGFIPRTVDEVLEKWVSIGGDYEELWQNYVTGEEEHGADFEGGGTWEKIYWLWDVSGSYIGEFTGDELEEDGPDLFDETNLPIAGVYPVYLSMQNPLVIEGDEAFWNEIPWETTDPVTGEVFEELLTTNEVAKMAEMMGYDGVIFRNIYDFGGEDAIEMPSDVYVVFEPTQIKSVYNKGTWSLTNPDIYLQVKGEPDIEERSWGQTVRDANITEDWLRELLLDRKFMYEVKHNEDSLLAAAKLLNDKGEAYVLGKLKSSLEADAILFAASQILTYKYMETGEREYAMDILALTAEKATTAGQAIQILSVWNKQTPEGMLRNVRKEFDDLSTEAQKKELEELHNKIRAEAKRINKAAVTKLKIKKATERLAKMKQQEMDDAVIAGSTELTSRKLRGEKIETAKKTENIENMGEAIMKVVTDHYDGEPGSLLQKLKDLGLNDFEARELARFVSFEMKALTETQNRSIIQELFRKKDEALDKQLSDVMADGKYGEAMKLVVGQKLKIPVLTSEMAKHIYERGQEINSLPEGSRERLVAAARLIRDITEQMPVSRGQKLATFQTMMQLLNFKTLLRNWLGNGMFKSMDTMALNVIGAPLDIMMSRLFKTGKRTHIFRLMDAHKAQKEGYKQGWEWGKQDALEGINTTDNDIGKLELKSYRTFKRDTPLGQLETLLNLGMRATDRAAFTAAYFDSIQEQMQIEGVTVPTQQMHEIATAIGLYRTFNDTTRLSESLGGIKKYLNKIGYQGFGLGELLLKYPRTPANILGRAVDYSPAGFLVTLLKVATDSSGSNYMKQRIAVEGLSRALAGSSMIVFGMLMARLGVLTGSVPDPDEDETVYNLKKQAGLRDYSVNTSALFRILTGQGFKSGELREGDILASYDWAEPLAMGLAIGADTVLTEDKYSALDALSTVVRAWEVGVTTLAEQPVLTGLTSAFKYGDIPQAISQALLRMPSSFAPSILNQVAQVVDGRATDPYTLYSKSHQAWNAFKNRIPGARNSLPGRIDVLGDNQMYYEQNEFIALRVLKAMVSPSIITTYTPTDEMELILDLYAEAGIREALPKAPSRQYTEGGVTYKFEPKEFEAASKWLGENSKKAIANSIGQYGYAQYWTSDRKAQEVKDLLGTLREELKAKFIRGDFR